VRRIKLVLAVSALMLTMMAAAAGPAVADIFNGSGCDSSGNNCDFSGNTCTTNNDFLDAFFSNLFGGSGPFGTTCDPTTNGGVSNGVGQDSSNGDTNLNFNAS
jgi:hypothetical protein